MTTPQRLPQVNSDDGTWGDILRQYLKKEHYDDGTDNAVNGGHQTITIRAGTATAGTAPLKFTSGTLLTTPEAGAVEFNTDSLYFTQTTSTTRKKIAAYDDSSGATGDIYYRNSSGYFTRLGVGGTGNVLAVSGGIPTWSSTIGNTSTITVKDANFTVQDDGDTTKQLQFQLSGITTGTTRTLTVPDASTTIVGTDAAQILTNKILSSSTIDNSNQIAAKAGNFVLQDQTTTSKKLQFDLTGISSGATVTYDATGAGNAAASVTSTNWSHTIGGSATVVIAAVQIWANSSAAPNNLTAQVGATSMIQLGAITNYVTAGGEWGSIVLFGLTSPPTGIQTITVSISGGLAMFVGGNSVSYNGATAFSNVYTNSGTGSTTLSQSVGSDSGEIIFQAFGGYNQNLSSYNQTSRYNQNFVNGTNLSLLMGDAAGGSTVSFSATASASTSWGAVAIRLAGSVTRTLTVPNASTTIVGTDATQTLTNKTFDTASNTLKVNGNSLSGTPNSTTFLRGDGAWTAISGGGYTLQPARVATTGSETYTISSGNVTQINGTTIDGVSPSVNDRILIKDAPAATGLGVANSTNPSNGVYSVTSNTTNLSLSRVSDMSGSVVPSGLSVFIEAGTNAGNVFVVTTPSSSAAFTYGTGNIAWSKNSTDTATATLSNKTLTTPTIADFTNANHNHTNAAGGGQLGLTALSSTAYNTAPTASTLAEWDANKNLSSNAFIQGYTTTVTAAGTTTLTISSTQIQVLTGSSTQTVVLPTTSVVAGAQYTIVNQSSGNVTVQSSGGNSITILSKNGSGIFTAVVNTPTTAANWNMQYIGPPRVDSTTSSATPAINTDLVDEYDITALAVNITSMTSSLSGSPVNGQMLILRFKDNGTARTITWGTSFVSSGIASLISTTVISKTHYVGFIYDSTSAKWVCIAADGAGY